MYSKQGLYGAKNYENILLEFKDCFKKKSRFLENLVYNLLWFQKIRHGSKTKFSIDCNKQLLISDLLLL